MTIEEMNMKYGTPIAPQAPVKLSSFETRWRGSDKGFVGNIKTAFTERKEKGAEAIIKAPTAASGALQLGGQAAEFVGDVGFEAIKAVPFLGSFVEKVAKEAGENIAEGKGAIGQFLQSETGKKAVQKFQSFDEDTKNDIGALFNMATIFPIGKGAKVGAEAVGTGIKTTGKTVAVTGRATKGVGEVVVQSAITPTVKEAERILKYRAKEPFLKRVTETLTGKAERPITRGQTVVEKGIQGSEKMIGVQAKRANQELWEKTIAPAIEKSPKVITKEELFSPIEKVISETTEPGRRQAFMDAYDAIKADFNASPEIISLKEAQKLKSELDEFTPEKLFKGKSVANEYATLKNEMANEIRKITYETLDDVNIKKAYLDWANLKELEKLGVKALTEAGRQAGSGKLVTYFWDKLTIPVKTIGGRVLYRVGNSLEFIGDKGIKRFGEFLEKNGFSKP